MERRLLLRETLKIARTSALLNQRAFVDIQALSLLPTQNCAKVIADLAIRVKRLPADSNGPKLTFSPE